MKISAGFCCVIALVLLTSITALAQTVRGKGRLRGDVADAAENAPIKNAFVLVHSDSSKKDVPAKLNEHAQFSLMLVPGLYDVFVAAPGFSPVSKKIEISRDHTTIFKARLKPDEEHLQESR